MNKKTRKFITTCKFKIGRLCVYLGLYRVQFKPRLFFVPDDEGSWKFKSLLFGKYVCTTFNSNLSYIEAKNLWKESFKKRRCSLGKRFYPELEKKVEELMSKSTCTQLEVDSVYDRIQKKYETLLLKLN